MSLSRGAAAVVASALLLTCAVVAVPRAGAFHASLRDGATAAGGDPVGGLVREGSVAVGADPDLATWNASSGAGGGDVYVASASGTVSVLQGGTAVATVNLTAHGDGPYDPIDDPASSSVLVTFRGYGGPDGFHNVSVLQGPVADGSQPVSTLAGMVSGDQPGLGVYDLSTGTVYLAEAGVTSGLAVVGGASLTRFATVAFPSTYSPGALAFDPPTGRVYAADLSNNSVRVVSGLALAATVPVPTLANTLNRSASGEDYASDIAYDPVDGDMYVADSGANRVTVLNGTLAVANVSVGGMPYAVAYDPADGEMLVANRATDTVSVLAGTSVVGTVAVGGAPTDLAFDAADDDMLVVNSGSGNVSVLQGSSVLGSIAVGSDPVDVVYDTVTGDAYVVNAGSANVTVLVPVTNGGPSFPVYGWVLVGLVVLLLAVLAVVLLRGRRPGPAPTSVPAPPGSPGL